MYVFIQKGLPGHEQQVRKHHSVSTFYVNIELDCCIFSCGNLFFSPFPSNFPTHRPKLTVELL